MGNTAIEINNVSKMYRLGEVGTGTLSHDINRWWHRIRGKEDPYLKLGQENKRDSAGGEYVWAIKDVSFDVQQGEVLGIIGKNGAGKSTLLKLLSRVTAPTTGSICAKGRIASLLEVGTGFHPELTGRENIFLNGAILGMTKNEIKRKFDEIVDFAGVERYIDTPVKRYSSGMYVRLAFGVAAHLESEILIVDEVLAVGDAEFQNKCLGKMKDVSRGEGRTVLFVSHNMGAVKNLCTHALLMEHGKISLDSAPANVIESYLSSGSESERFVRWLPEERPRSGEIEVFSVKILGKNHDTNDILTTTDNLKIEVEYMLKEEIKDLRVVANIVTPDGIDVFSTSDFGFQNDARLRLPGHYKSICYIPGGLLNAGKYIAKIDFDIPKTRAIIMDLAVEFTISELMFNQLGVTVAHKPAGVVHPYLEWEIINLKKEDI
jgi:lipopolysaccharide transport system ATP-binding protein